MMKSTLPASKKKNRTQIMKLLLQRDNTATNALVQSR